MKKVLKICISDWKNASRDQRELAVVKELGGDVEILAKGEKTGEIDYINGFKVFRISTRPLVIKRLVFINRVFAIFSWAYVARRKNVDIISGHDLPGLLIGYISNLFKKHKAKLVYDSHEFEIGRAIKRNKISKYLIMKIEKYLIKRCCFSIMVNKTIAKEVQKIYKLKDEPIVARNIPEYLNIDIDKKVKIINKRNDIIKVKNWDENAFIIMYHGMIFKNRGIEQIIDVLKINHNINAFILGDCPDNTYLDFLIKKIDDLGLNDRIYLHKAVPQNILYQYIGIANVGIIVLSGEYLSYYYSLPNKFFENIQANVPVIVSDFPEMSKVVKQYDIGLICENNNLYDLNACIERLRKNKIEYNKYKANLKFAKETLNWQKEKIDLKKAYKEIMD